MNFGGFELEYDGHRISEFGAVIGAIGRDGKQEYNALGTYESNTIMSITSPIKRNYGGKYTNGLEKSMQLAFPKGINYTDFAEFQNVFFNKRNYRKLCFTDSKYKRDFYYMAKLINPKFTTINDMICQVDFDIDYESPYAIENEECVETWSSNGTYGHNCESHYDGDIFPNIEIKGSGSITIENLTNESKFIIDLSNGLLSVSIDDKLQVVFSDGSNGLKNVDLDNGRFLYLNQGYNEIKISGTIDKVKMSYLVYKKVGA